MVNGETTPTSPAHQQALGADGNQPHSSQGVSASSDSEKLRSATILENVPSGNVTIALPNGVPSQVDFGNSANRPPLPGSTQSGSKQLPALPGSQINAIHNMPRLPGVSAGNRSSQ